MENSNHVVTVKAIYEPGADLLGPDDGGFYTMTQPPQYMKSSGWLSSQAISLAVYNISLTMSRYWEATDGVHGVSRIRTPSTDVYYNMDMFELGIHDHNSGYSAHSEIPLENGEDIEILWEGVAKVHALDFHLVDIYNTNFVVAPVRSLSNDEQPTPVLPNFACSGYEVAGYGPNCQIGPDDEYLPLPDTVYGTDGYVFWGAINLTQKVLTDYVLHGSDIAYLLYTPDLNVRDRDGSFLTSGNFSFYMKKMAQEAYQAHLAGNDEWWDSGREALSLTYHQIQHYVLNRELLTRAEADNITIPWCMLHDTCIAAGTGGN